MPSSLYSSIAHVFYNAAVHVITSRRRFARSRGCGLLARLALVELLFLANPSQGSHGRFCRCSTPPAAQNLAVVVPTPSAARERLASGAPGGRGCCWAPGRRHRLAQVAAGGALQRQLLEAVEPVVGVVMRVLLALCVRPSAGILPHPRCRFGSSASIGLGVIHGQHLHVFRRVRVADYQHLWRLGSPHSRRSPASSTGGRQAQNPDAPGCHRNGPRWRLL
mmetsp:Transcript_33634/g.84778  ORF Transcript_33634/g.84778 Transcript_33634/m.84778 type:complete len:221 (+) Transcript_33634:258-920(+)